MSRLSCVFYYAVGVATGIALTSFHPAIRAAMERMLKTHKKESPKSKKVKFNPTIPDIALAH